MLCASVLLFLCVVFAYAVDAQPQTNITHVHVVYMNHLDVGYDGIYPELGFIVNVINKYFDVFFPRAYETAATLQRMNISEGFIYTTHAFLVSLYLDCPPGMGLHCPNDSMVAQFNEAVSNGWIAWHAGAFNAEPELYDPPMLQAFISLAHDLCRMFGLPPVATMSQRDVPGLTRSAIPLLKQAGVQALSFGANGYSAPAAVPSAFLWRDPPSGAELVTLYHPGGYGGVMLTDAVVVPGLSHALIMAFNQDNQGPQNVSQVLEIIAQVKLDFPGAEIRASTWDAFTSLLAPLAHTLPLVEQEMGDTWIYGAASDPLKVSSWRAILRARTACLEAGVCNATEYAFKNFTRILLKGAEHTWGMQSGEQHLMVYFDWTNAMFERLRADPEIQNMQTSWVEQRLWVTDYPLQALALGNSTADRYLIAAIRNELSQLAPSYPNIAGWRKVAPGEFSCGRFVITFAAGSGAIVGLLDTVTNTQWASAASPLGLPVYQTLTEFDFEDFLLAYSLCQGADSYCSGGLRNDFSKPWLQVTAEPTKQLVVPTLLALFMTNLSSDTTSFLIAYEFPSQLVTQYGAPASVWVAITVNGTSGNVSVDASFFNKTTTRQPEALWLQFTPTGSGQGTWSFDKLGEWVGTNETMLNGSRHLHAVNSGVRFTNGNGTRLTIQLIDTAVVAAGSPNGLPVPLDQDPDMEGGLWANVFNNFWNTNYILWYPYLPEDQSFHARFSMCFDC